MLHKLKRRFILINMLLVLVILSVLFGTILILTYRAQVGEVTQSLEIALEQGYKQAKPEAPDALPLPEEIPSAEPSNDRDKPLPYVYASTVLVTADGTILTQGNAGVGMTEELLREAVAAALGNRKNTDTVAGMNLIYAKRETPEGTRIAFASSEHITVTVRNTALVAGGACLAALVIFYLVSRLLASLAIRPTREAWEKQKQFVADASHDLRTPLTVILANTELLRQHKEETVASQLKWIESTEAEARHMRDMTGALLELAKSEKMLEALPLQQINGSDLAEQAVLQFEPVAFEKQITLQADIQADLMLLGDAASFVKLAHILLDNAIKYSPAGETVSISLHIHGKTVRFAVSNRGTPIAAEDLPHIFERFYRTDKARGAGGFGLGLAIAKNLAEAQAAKIFAESTAEHGTVFTVVFRV